MCPGLSNCTDRGRTTFLPSGPVWCRDPGATMADTSWRSLNWAARCPQPAPGTETDHACLEQYRSHTPSALLLAFFPSISTLPLRVLNAHPVFCACHFLCLSSHCPQRRGAQPHLKPRSFLTHAPQCRGRAWPGFSAQCSMREWGRNEYMSI